jgi:SAM-dependent methyltransferase
VVTSRAETLAASWDANAASWVRAVRERRIASRRAGTDAAIVAAVTQRRPARLLDVGCGEGWLVRAAVAATGCAAVGVDGAAALIEAARAADPAGDYRPCAYADLVAGGHGLAGGFDLAAFNYALFDDDAAVGALLAAVGRLLAPGGAIVIQTPHPDAGPDPGPGAAGPGIAESVAAGSGAADGWQVEDFAGFEGGGWSPMPWYRRSGAGWRRVIGGAGLTVHETREPAAPGGAPLSLLMVCAPR